MRKKKVTFIMVAMIVVVLIPWVLGCSSDRKSKPYGVFIGCEGEKLLQYGKSYEMVVAESTSLTTEQLFELKRSGKKVYTYLDVGSLETYRDYYHQFEAYKLDVYENWPDEYWMDVTCKEWQEYVVETLAKELVEDGYDGLFLDNFDVYYQYPEEEVYESLKCILEGLRQYQVDIIINGGDTFVSRLLEEGCTDLIDGINQECVFSTILDYEKDKFGRQCEEDRQYFLQYIEAAAKQKLQVYLLEYTKDGKLIKEIEQYCREKKYLCYISDSVALDKN